MKFTNFFKILIIIFFLAILTLLTILTFDNHLRRSVFFKAPVFINMIYTEFIKRDLRRMDLEGASNKIIKEINLSEKFLGSKNNMLKYINKQIELVIDNLLTQDDYDKIQDLLKLFNEKNPNVYLSSVAYAKALSNDDLNKAKQIIKQSINIFPAHEQAYRVGFNLGLKYKDKIFLNELCEIYNSSNFGGEEIITSNNFFGSYSNNQIAFRFHNKKKVFYPFENFEFNKKTMIELIPEKKMPFTGIDLFINPLKGLKLKINSFKLYNDKNVTEIISDLTGIGNYAYINRNEFNGFTIDFYNKKQNAISFFNKSDNEFQKIEIEIILQKINFFPEEICN